MEVNRYIFQSPYPNQVQIGRPDVSAGNEEKSAQDGAEVVKAANSTLSEAANFKATQTQEVEATVESSALLDTYA